jgi:excinuclease UvrABC nuclease subunit
MREMTVEVGPHLTYQQFTAQDFDQRGVYLVYRVNREDGRLRLIYIGKSNDISDRVTEGHEHFRDWVRWAYDNVDALRFSIVKLPPEGDINSCEEAMIYKFQPPINDRCKETFNNEDIQISFSGRNVCGRAMIEAMRT